MAPVVEVSHCPELSTAYAVTPKSPWVGRSTGSVQVVVVAPGLARVASSVANAAPIVPSGWT